MNRVAPWLALAVWMTPLGGSAQPASGTAREHRERGERLFGARDYAGAAEAFAAAYTLDPRPTLLYVLAQAQRLSGDCDGAVVTYRRFLETHPEPRAEEAARLNINRCTGATEPARPTTSTVGATTATQAASAGSSPPVRASHGNWRAGVISGAGLATTLIGASLWGVAVARIDDANDTDRYDDFVARSTDAASAPALRTGGIVLVAAGGALIVGGVVHALVVARANRAAARSGSAR